MEIKYNVKIEQIDYINEKDIIIYDSLYDEPIDCYKINNLITANLFDQYFYAYDNRKKALAKLNEELINYKVGYANPLDNKTVLNPITANSINNALELVDMIFVFNNGLLVYKITKGPIDGLDS